MSSIKWRFMAWDYCKNRAVSCAVKQPEKNFLIDHISSTICFIIK